MTVKPVYSPTSDDVEQSQLAAFTRFLNERTGLSIGDYNELWEFSVQEQSAFWREVARYFGLSAQAENTVVRTDDPMPYTRWFPETPLNYARHILNAQKGEVVAVAGYDEFGQTRTLSGDELTSEAHGLASHLRRAGVGPEDRVVGYISNSPEAAVALLATSLIGATWSSVGLDYAAEAAADRLAPLEPKAVILSLTSTLKGHLKDNSGEAARLVSLLPTLEAAVTYSQREPISPLEPVPAGVTVADWKDAVAPGEVVVADTEFSTPLWVLFSSGTTGRPKGIVHSHGGVVIELLKMLTFHFDIRRDDVFFWYSSPSWVMWNVQISALATGAGIVTYDGNPAHPDPLALWRLLDSAEATFFGLSPGLLDLTRAWSSSPLTGAAQQRLRALGTTGAPISPEAHEWAVEMSGGAPVHSISGGTDVAGAFAGGARGLPIFPGELSRPCLGVALEAWNESGEPVQEEVGELVITKPMPSMPVKFWNDPDFELYLQSYFDHFEGVWRHGDWITLTDRRSLIFHGRSDSTINRGGVRMGSSDIYNCVDNVPGVADSLVLGVELEGGDYWMPLFVVTEGEAGLTEDLVADIRGAIRKTVSPRHVPDSVIEVEAVPRTLTGKRLEVPLKRVLQGGTVEDSVQESAVADVQALHSFLAVATVNRDERRQ